jgi:N-acetylmuramic acid 6-phosphate etherase
MATSKWRRLSTEAVNPASVAIDTLPLRQAVELMVSDQRGVLEALHGATDEIAAAAATIAGALGNGGRLILIGAGTSGRLGVLEASEIPPTFGTPPALVQAIIAGGRRAVYRAKEDAEDDYDEGIRSVRRVRLSRKDVVIGITASGVTPFVRGALAHARRTAAATIGLTCNPEANLRGAVDQLVALPTGPEVIAGSTRLKAGTATKMVLNILTTLAMVQQAKTYGNLMVDVKPGSRKLRDRARRIVATVTGLDARHTDRLLRRAKWDVKTAIVMQKAAVTPGQARARLRDAGGSVRIALGES